MVAIIRFGASCSSETGEAAPGDLSSYSAANDRELARQVAEHKSMFFAEKDAGGTKIDYFQAAAGGLRLIPDGPSLAALEKDYAAMLEDGLLAMDQPAFSAVLGVCRTIEETFNRLARPGR